MIRLLFVPFFALFLFSCEDSSKEIDPLFYSISEADSTRCMDEILDGIVFDAQESQRIQEEIDVMLFNPNRTFCGIREVFTVLINSRGDILVDMNFDSLGVAEGTYDYFMFNRNLTSKETTAASVNSAHEGFSKPFYNRFNLDEIEMRIDETTEEWQEMKQSGADPALVEYFHSKIEEWEARKKTLLLIGAKSLSEASRSAHVRFEYPIPSSKSEEVLREIAFAFYQMRNYECLRYFNETYLSLYERSHRKEIPLDKEKLEALKVLHPISLICYEWKKRKSTFVEAPPIEQVP